MPQWMAVVLIFVAFGSLIIALYCLFFMVPVKRFWERINSLGGGMKGIEAHLSGVRDEFARRLNELESSTGQQIEEGRQAAQATLDRLGRDCRGVQREMEVLRKELESLQAVAQSTRSLTRELQQLRGDFDGLDVELRESVRQLVADSFASVESTVLSALDAVQEEILYGTSGPSGGSRPRQPRRQAGPTSPDFARPGGTHGRDNIIAVRDLFAALNQGKGEKAEEPEESADETGGGEEDQGSRNPTKADGD